MPEVVFAPVVATSWEELDRAYREYDMQTYGIRDIDINPSPIISDLEEAKGTHSRIDWHEMRWGGHGEAYYREGVQGYGYYLEYYSMPIWNDIFGPGNFDGYIGSDTTDALSTLLAAESGYYPDERRDVLIRLDGSIMN